MSHLLPPPPPPPLSFGLMKAQSTVTLCPRKSVPFNFSTAVLASLYVSYSTNTYPYTKCKVRTQKKIMPILFHELQHKKRFAPYYSH